MATLTPEQAVVDMASNRKRMLAGIPLAVAQGSLYFEGRVKAYASGRPGPRAPHGNYRRTIKAQPVVIRRGGTDVSATVGSNHPAARRLEEGFSDTDSIGRVYNQPPYPHWVSAIPDLDRYMQSELRRLLD